jgi:hypothetical protein
MMNKFPTYTDLLPYIGTKLDCMLLVDPEAGVEDSIAVSKGEHAVLLVDRVEDCVEWTVWVLRIQFGLSGESYIFDREETARQQLYNYVVAHWSERYPNSDLTEDLDLAIREYFEDNEGESYTLTPQPVLCEPEYGPEGYTTGESE